jgi:hypothetical protein
MRLGFRSKVLLVSVIAVVAIGCIMMFHSFTQRQAPKGGNLLTTLLEAPLFISSAEAAQTTTAFPEDEAGISAYVKVLQVDIEKMKSIFTEVEEVGDNYIIGITPIPDFGGNIDVHVYADIDGWLVAYIKAGEPAAKIMQWGDTTSRDPQIDQILSTTLEDALYSAGDATGAVVSQRDIKYYDFEAPEANGMTLFIRIRKGGKGSNIVQVELPATYALYESSYYHFMSYRGNQSPPLGDSELKVDGSRISHMGGNYHNSSDYYARRTLDSYKGAITTGILHKIEISYDPESTNSSYICAAGVATILIYRMQ